MKIYQYGKPSIRVLKHSCEQTPENTRKTQVSCFHSSTPTLRSTCCYLDIDKHEQQVDEYTVQTPSHIRTSERGMCHSPPVCLSSHSRWNVFTSMWRLTLTDARVSPHTTNGSPRLRRPWLSRFHSRSHMKGESPKPIEPIYRKLAMVARFPASGTMELDPTIWMGVRPQAFPPVRALLAELNAREEFWTSLREWALALDGISI
ncbi:hypothetical protein BJ166DRAFT_332648 [Pestalotiopsis sp. NC0098]|nr:hypothetical protein BJ166DRAFT_332648 [Pestalotiopsis sp. NC0098]